MSLDPIKNLATATVSFGYDDVATTIVLTNGGGNRLPDPIEDGNFNLNWWNSSDYSNPSLDPFAEFIRVTGPPGIGDTKTILRGQEGSSASFKNIGGKVYRVSLSMTKLTYDAINAAVSFVDQDVQIGASPALIGANITEIPTENLTDMEELAIAYAVVL